MGWKVNRKNVIGKHLCYWLRKANILVIDHGSEDGDIHIYKHVISTDSKHLKSVLDEYVKGDISSRSHLEINELKSDYSYSERFLLISQNKTIII